MCLTILFMLQVRLFKAPVWFSAHYFIVLHWRTIFINVSWEPCISYIPEKLLNVCMSVLISRINYNSCFGLVQHFRGHSVTDQFSCFRLGPPERGDFWWAPKNLHCPTIARSETFDRNNWTAFNGFPRSDTDFHSCCLRRNAIARTIKTF